MALGHNAWKCNIRLLLAKQFSVSLTCFNTALNDVPIRKTRNIGIIAHIDAGKTTTTERMLFYSGRTKHIGNVDEGDTVTDYLPAERQRGITIQLAAISIPWNNHKINIIDTPGHADFTFEVIRSLRVLDAAVTILDGVAGVEAQTEKVWVQAHNLNIPKIVYVNKMDRPGAGFSRTVKEIVTKLQTRVVLCNVPYFEKSKGDFQFAGVLDVINCKLLKWKPEQDSTGCEVSVFDLDDQTIPNIEELREIVVKCRESVVDTLGELEESVVDSFLEHDGDYMKVPAPVLVAALRHQTVMNKVTPVFCGSSFKNIGVQPLLDGITSLLPSPLEICVPEITTTRSKKKNAAAIVEPVLAKMDTVRGLIVNGNPNFTLALAFKVMTHATKGVMTFFRVYSGKLTTNTTVINTRTGKKLLMRKLLLMYGDAPEDVKHIAAGNIGVILGHEDDIFTGDTLVSHGPVKKGFNDSEANIKLLPIDIPPSLFNSGIEPMTAGDQRYMDECIKVLVREDPSLKVSVDEEMGQTVLSGMGELHLDIVKDRLVNEMKAKVRLRDVAVSYKETLVKENTDLCKASSPDGLVEMTVSMASFEGRASESEFATLEGAVVLDQDNNIVIFPPDCINPDMLTAIEERRWKSEHLMDDLYHAILQGCKAGLQIGGPVLGLPLHSTVVIVKSWKFPVELNTHGPVDLSSASRRAVGGFVTENAKLFGLLEPLMETRVYVDSNTVGEVSHDLSQRCQAVITSVEDESTQNVDALAWASEEAEKMYLPPDYTLSSGDSRLDLKNRKTVVAETPLREMLGYLSRLRSITQGSGSFDMTFIRMARVNPTRMSAIINNN